MLSQQDVFIETIVKRRKSGKDYLIIAGLISLFIIIIYISLMFLKYTFSFIPFIVAGGGFGLYYLITSLDKEFEYICTNGHLDIDMIIHKRKRKRQVSMAAADMEILAPVDSDDYKVNNKNTSIKRLDLTTNTGSDNVWFFIGSYKGSRVMVTFEPNERILRDLKRHNPSKVRFNMIQG